MFSRKLCTQFVSCCERIGLVHGMKQTNYLHKPHPLQSYSFVRSHVGDAALLEDLKNSEEKTPQSFSSMLRNSAFVRVGQHSNVKVVGKIFQVQDENIYVDFGGKFHCVCNLDVYSSDPEVRAQFYRGRHVVILLKDFELSARFLGATRDTTLLEAEGKLIALYTPWQRKSKVKTLGSSLEDKVEINANNDGEIMEYEKEIDEIMKYESKEGRITEYEKELDKVVEYEKEKDKIMEYEKEENKIMKQTKDSSAELEINKDDDKVK